MRARGSLARVVVLAAALAACGPAAPPPVVAQRALVRDTGAGTRVAPPPEPVVSDADPVPPALSVEGVKRSCDEHLATAQAFIAQIEALKDAPSPKLTFEATLGRFDLAMLEIFEAGQVPYLMARVHPDAAVREAAKLCEPKAEALTSALYLDADLAAVLQAYAAKNEPLEGERNKLLADVLRDLRRNGLGLPAEKRAELRRMNDEIARLGQDFELNLASAVGKVELQPRQLVGLPPDYVAKHKPNKAGKIEITTDYADYFPFVTYAADRRAALELYVAFTNRGGQENVQILERLLKLRHDKANLLGYATWADFALETRMAKTPRAVKDFLAEVRAAVKAPAKAELAELMRMHVKLGGKRDDKLAPPDRYFLAEQVKAERWKLDEQALAPYFEVSRVVKGLLAITASMYGLEYLPVKLRAENAWHPDVSAFEVALEGKVVGRIYLDLYARDGKYEHTAMFPLRQAARLPDGRRLAPMAALSCSFPKPGLEPTRLTHEEVITLFHELGHVLHHVLTRSQLATYAGTNTVRDFVEVPSQVFEEWAWSREVLDRFAVHEKTGAAIPDDLWKAMKAARSFGRALDTQRQVFLATIDQELHTRAPGFDSTRVVEEIQDATDSFAYVKGTHFQSSFGHLIGYDAGYYGYAWALALSRDALTRFKREGLLDTKVAAAWRDEVLAKGGGEDPRALLKAFLGREPSNTAYFEYLRASE